MAKLLAELRGNAKAIVGVGPPLSASGPMTPGNEPEAMLTPQAAPGVVVFEIVVKGPTHCAIAVPKTIELIREKVPELEMLGAVGATLSAIVALTTLAVPPK
jgi:hypothetical protein